MYLFHCIILLFSIFIFNSCDGGDDNPSVEGCTDSNAINFNSNADKNDGSCEYGGCIDLSACNYNSSASYDDGSCDFIDNDECDCDGNRFDCFGECGGLAEYDECGLCASGNSGNVANSDQDCNGDCNGNSIIDSCGECVIQGSECDEDCNGISGGSSFNESACNLCGGCNLLINTIYFSEDQQELWYNINHDIYGFQLDVYGIEIIDITNGNASDVDLEIQYQNGSNFSRIIGYDYDVNGSYISDNCGNLFNISYTGSISNVNNIVFSGIYGNPIQVEYYTCD